MEESNDHEDMLRVMKQNAELIRENNKILKKIYRQNIASIAIRILWICVIVGVPFAVYFYVLEPYFDAFGSNYEVFKQGMAEIPGLKGLGEILP